MSETQASLSLTLAGMALAAVGCYWIATRFEGIRPGAGPPLEPAASPESLDRRWLAALVVVVAIGVTLRFVGLGVKGLAHPEAYIPGLDLPPDISVPPPRHGLGETWYWHFTTEPHPFGYYLAMWAWTKAFGASLVSIRFPEALAGALSLLLIFRLATASYGARVGAIATAMLALHGFHLFWSQAARMYAPGAFLGLLSTYLLLEMHRTHGRDRILAAGYVAATVAGALTIEFFWPLLAGQMLWTALQFRGRLGALPRVAVVQTLAFILSAPMLSHALMTGRNNAAGAPTLTFLRRYFSFGFLFQHGAYFEPRDAIPIAVAIAVLILSLLLIARGVGVAPAPVAVDAEVDRSAMKPLALAALGMSMVMLAIALFSERRRLHLTILSVLPFLALTIPVVVGSAGAILAKVAPRLGAWLRSQPPAFTLIPLLAVVPTAALFIASFKVTLLAPRGFLLFVPFLLIVTAAGALALARRREVAVLLALALTVIFSASAVIVRRAPISPRDYQGLARAMNARLEPSDLVFVRRSWATTPLFYYLPHDRLIAKDFAAATQQAPEAKIWVVAFGLAEPPGLAEALATYQAVDSVAALNMKAIRFSPRSR